MPTFKRNTPYGRYSTDGKYRILFTRTAYFLFDISKGDDHTKVLIAETKTLKAAKAAAEKNNR